MRLATVPAGSEEQVAGYHTKFVRETTIDLVKSPTTGNAMIVVTGAVEVQNVKGPFDVTVRAATYDVGTKRWDAHGTVDALPILSVHVRGNEKGPTGLCLGPLCTALTPPSEGEEQPGGSAP